MKIFVYICYDYVRMESGNAGEQPDKCQKHISYRKKSWRCELKRLQFSKTFSFFGERKNSKNPHGNCQRQFQNLVNYETFLLTKKGQPISV